MVENPHGEQSKGSTGARQTKDVHSLIESFRFEDEDGYGYEYEYEIKLKVFARIPKKERPGKLHFTFFSPKMLVRLFILKEVKPTPDSKMIKFLTFDNLFPPLRHSC